MKRRKQSVDPEFKLMLAYAMDSLALNIADDAFDMISDAYDVPRPKERLSDILAEEARAGLGHA